MQVLLWKKEITCEIPGVNKTKDRLGCWLKFRCADPDRVLNIRCKQDVAAHLCTEHTHTSEWHPCSHSQRKWNGAFLTNFSWIWAPWSELLLKKQLHCRAGAGVKVSAPQHTVEWGWTEAWRSVTHTPTTLCCSQCAWFVFVVAVEHTPDRRMFDTFQFVQEKLSGSSH